MSNRFAHYELSTDDVAGAQKFLKKVFDWKFKPMPAMNYTLIDTGEKNAGGGMQKKMTAEQPTGWIAYVSVDDVKKTVAKAARNGAHVLLPFQSIGEMGAIGIFVHPAGGAIGVWENVKPAKPTGKKKPTKK